ncbi:hypothetical protein [Legionella sainthelensi]|nr:hypothetical protein [Legionella sainthelensi]
MFLRKNFINQEKVARDKLVEIDATIQQLRVGLNLYADEGSSIYGSRG